MSLVLMWMVMQRKEFFEEHLDLNNLIKLFTFRQIFSVIVFTPIYLYNNNAFLS